MPAYDFKCRDCGAVVETVRPATDDSAVPCPACGGETKRVFTPVGVHFKGGGFHSTDYRTRAEKDKRAETDKPSEIAPKPCEAAGSGPACGGCPAASGDAS
jgi:putative FmdB family regulatory protein